MSCERVVETADLLREGSLHTLKIHRGLVDVVVEAPRGAHFTACEPDADRDEAFQREYAAAAADPAAWVAWKAKWIDAPSHDAYLAALDAKGAP